MKALVDRLRALPAADRQAIYARCTAEEIAALRWVWPFWARPDERAPGAIDGRGQLPPPGNWTWHAHIGGRGSGKTEASARWINAEAARLGPGCIVHLLGQTIEDAVEVMINGPSGLRATAPPWQRPELREKRSALVLSWPSGARGRVFSAEKARKGRGPQCNRFWIDDPAAFGPNGQEVLEQLLFGFRINAPDGGPPRGVISSTPIDSAILEWIMRGMGDRATGIVYSRSATDDNRANLSQAFFDVTLKGFEGSALEQQERYGVYDRSAKVFAGVEFTVPPIRIDRLPGRLRRVAVWIDPALSSATKACEVGVVAVGELEDGRGVLLEDASGHYGAVTRDGMTCWMDPALDCLERWEHLAPYASFGVETNKAEAQAEALLSMAIDLRRQKAIAEGQRPRSLLQIKTVHTDKRKATRADLLVADYRAGNVVHLAGLGAVEAQLHALSATRRTEADRADAAVYGLLDMFNLLDKVRPGHVNGSSGYSVGLAGRSAFNSPMIAPTQAAPHPSSPMTMNRPGVLGRPNF